MSVEATIHTDARGQRRTPRSERAARSAGAACPSRCAAAAACTRPFVGIAAVLLGAVISTLYGRITTFGLADLRGAVHAGVRRGRLDHHRLHRRADVHRSDRRLARSGVRTAARADGLRRASSRLTSALIPFAPDLPTLLLGQAVGGLSSGTFIPLTIGFVLQSLQPALWPYGIAAYGLNLELSLNIPASLEGWYLDHLSWHWIFWQGALLALPMLVCIHFGMPRQPVNREALRDADFWGMFYRRRRVLDALCGARSGQPARLAELGTDMRAAAGGRRADRRLRGAGAVGRASVDHPRFLLRRNIALLMAILVLYRFIILSTSYLIPQYLTTMQNFRSLDVGKVLAWIAVPQFLLAPLIATLLRWLDPRIMLALGLWCVGVACSWRPS